MSEVQHKKSRRFHLFSHRGRTTQVPIYLGKQFRFFINQSDWKVIPMAGIIALLVSMVIRRNFFVTMEGNLMGSFALTCVAIWNGAFNSIQAVCRERAIIKREHRSGMHISAYVAAHMIYQFLLCLAQTALTMAVLRTLDVPIPVAGFITPFMLLDIGITMLLISYAADMMSLFLSSISRTTTGAMTLMPFILIFQLVFSGGIIPLPEWSRPLSNFTISSYGIQALAAQSGYNEQPMTSVWTTVAGLKDEVIGGTVTVGEVMEYMDNPSLQKYRDRVAVKALTVADVENFLDTENKTGSDEVLSEPVTVGQIMDFIRTNKKLEEKKDQTITVNMTVGEIMDIFGEENVKQFIQEKTAQAAYKQEYERSFGNIAGNWVMLVLFILLFAGLATIVLEMIDKDKR